MKFVDSHCHLDFEPLSLNLESVLKRARSAGVEKIVNIGASMRGSEKSIELANSYPNIWATVGLHPHDAGEILDFEGMMEKIKMLAKSDRVVAIGEIGLDYYNPVSRQLVNSDQKEKQKELFIAQLEIAKEENLPLVLHVRDAWDDFFSIISNFKFQTSNSQKMVVHCFTADEKIASRIVELGLYIGFTGFVTFEQAKFNYIREAAKIVPIEKLLIETDAPFLAPEPYRGKTNEPAYLLEIAKKIAEIKKIDLTKLADTTSENAENLFKI